MFKKLLTGTDWDYAGIKFKDAPPMLVDRSICTISEDEQEKIVFNIPNNPSPVESTKRCAALHYVNKEDIHSVTFYSMIPDKLIQPLAIPTP